MSVVGPILVAALFLAPAPPDPAEAEAKRAIEEFRKLFAAKDPEERCRAVAALVDTPHELVVKEIGATALADPEPSVRSVSAKVLGRFDGFKDSAGPLLKERLGKEASFPDVQYSIVVAIQKLGYTGATKELVAAGGHFKDEAYLSVTTEVIRTFGLQKDRGALPFLLSLAEYGEGEVIRGRKGPAIRVSSKATFAEARWAWMRQYGKNAIPKDRAPPDTLDKWWLLDLIDAVAAITGEEFEDSAAFRTYLTEHVRELGLKKTDLPAKPGAPK